MSVWRWCVDGIRSACIVLCYSLLLVFPVLAVTEKNESCQENAPLVFGVLPFISAEQLVFRFTPLVNYLSDNLQVASTIVPRATFIPFSSR